MGFCGTTPNFPQKITYHTHIYIYLSNLSKNPYKFLEFMGKFAGFTRWEKPWSEGAPERRAAGSCLGHPEAEAFRGRIIRITMLSW